jgi:hypothetical protein
MTTTSVAEIPLRKSLSADQLTSTIYRVFKDIPDPRSFSSPTSLAFSDALMSGLAVFGLKFPSLLQYDHGRHILDHNLKTLYHVERFVSDSYLRERLDELDPKFIRPAFLKLFTKLQRGKCLEAFEFLDGHYLLALDGTGHFSSSNVSCEQCCKKEHRNGSVTYYHQMLGASIVHPDQPSVIPLCPEPIINGDGSRKNDCERNAATRFIDHFKREHPHLNVIVLGDGIASNAPYVQLLEEKRMKYLLAAKPGDHHFLFDTVDASEETAYHEFTDEKGFFHQFRYLNGVPLNKSHPEVLVNFLEYNQTDPKGKETRFSWVTNIKIKQSNLVMLMRGGRSRWKVESAPQAHKKDVYENKLRACG